MDILRNYRSNAFTLAEVLITLGIIGVVAALTLPTLIQKHKKIEYASKLKQFYSMMSQAILISEINNGDKSTWSKTPPQFDEDGNRDLQGDKNANYEFFMKYIAPYLKYTKETIKQNNTFYLANGTKISMWNGSCVDFNVDVNGDKKPNEFGRDMFNFHVCTKKNYPPIGVYSLYSPQGHTRTELVDLCANYIDRNFCTPLIMKDGWEFKDDYPFKL